MTGTIADSRSDFTWSSNTITGLANTAINATKLRIGFGEGWPATINIGSNAFKSNQTIEEIEINDNIQVINGYAFYGCSKLKSALVGAKVVKGTYVFGQCTNLSKIRFTKLETLSGKYIFYNMRIDMVCPNTISTIEDSCFQLTTGRLLYEGTSEEWYGKNFKSPNQYHDSSSKSGIELYEKSDETPRPTSNSEANSLKKWKWIDEEKNKYVVYPRILYDQGESCLVLKKYLDIDSTEFTEIGVDQGLDSLVGVIDREAFLNAKYLQEIHIPNQIVEIGEDAFFGCDALQKVTINNLGYWCNINFKDGTTRIGVYSNPLNCGAGLYINNVKIRQIECRGDIKQYAFYGYKDLEEVFVTNSASFVGTSAFRNCTSLVEVKFGEKEEEDDTFEIQSFAFDGCSHLRKLTLPGHIKRIQENAFYNCSELSDVSFPTSLTSIGAYAFSNCAIREIDLKSASDIGASAFENCASLQWAKLSNLKIIPEKLFSGCKSLKEVILSNELTRLGSYCFSNCALTSITIPNSVLFIGKNAFENCTKLCSISLPFVGETRENDSWKQVSTGLTEAYFGYIFGGDSTDLLEIKQYKSGGLTQNQTYTSFKCPKNLKTISITDASYIHVGALSGLLAETVTLNGDIEVIRQFAFCPPEVSIPEEERGQSPFNTLAITGTIEKIEQYAFYGCNNISKVCINNLQNWCDILFDGNQYSNPLIYGAELIVKNQIVKHLVIPKSLKNKLEGRDTLIRTFCGCGSLVSIIVPENIGIAYQCFRDCKNLQQVGLRDGAYPYGMSFNGCSSLKIVRLMGADIRNNKDNPNNKQKPFGQDADELKLDFIYYGTTEQINRSKIGYPYGASNESTQKEYVWIDTDYIGFTFNKKHSMRDMNVYRVSNSNRYDSNISIDTSNKTAEASGIDGMYYFGAKHKSKKIPINIAFDNLTEEKLREWQNFCLGKEISQLILDEEPYKVYDAKITGAPSMKVICFDDENGQRVYKGEGTLEFTCYWPYARTPDEREYYLDYVIGDGKHLYNYWHATVDQWKEASGLTNEQGDNYENPGDIPSHFVVRVNSVEEGTALRVGTHLITLNGEYQDVQWDSETGLVSAIVDGKRQAIPYAGNAFGTIPVGGLAKDEVALPVDAELKYNYWYY